MRRVLAILAVLLPAVVGAGAAVRDWNPFVYPPQKIDFIFKHDVHEEEAACADCHQPDDDSDAQRMTLPDHELCTDCHDIDAAEAGEDTDPPASCETCHSAPITRAAKLARPLVDIPTSRLNFSHELHAEAKVKCGACHQGVTATTLATAAHLPSMDTCVSCHRKERESNACTTCHVADGGRLVTQRDGETFTPLGPHRPDRHGPGWAGGKHGAVAASNGGDCLSCHREKECSDCHSRDNDIHVHPPFWLEAHASRAEMGEHRCQTCHVVKSFCSDCHERQGLADRPGGTSRLAGRYHPDGWMTGTGPGSHAALGRFETQTCASCHQEETCMQCHGTTSGAGGAGISPHPDGFDPRTLKRMAPDSCVRCHRPDDPLLH